MRCNTLLLAGLIALATSQAGYCAPEKSKAEKSKTEKTESPKSASSTWTIDSAHARAAFSVRHMMISNVRGDFSKVSGNVEYDGKNVKSIKTDATIDVSTVSTGEPGRDEHLRGDGFFNVAKFPTMTFKSKKIAPAGKGKFKMTGDLTIHGVTKEVTFDVDGPSPEIKDKKGGTHIGASAVTKINRKDFGISYGGLLDNGGPMIGDDVDITLDIELIKSPDAPKSSGSSDGSSKKSG